MTALFDERYESNRAALVLAKLRYDQQLRDFVQGSPARLAYVQGQVDKIAIDCSEATGADTTFVATRLAALIAAEVDSLPRGKNEKNKKPDLGGDIVETDVTEYHDTVADENVYKPTERYDLNQMNAPLEGWGERDQKTTKAYSVSHAGNILDSSTWNPCFRCGKKLNPLEAIESPVCTGCTKELHKMAAGWLPDELGVGLHGGPQMEQQMNDNVPHRCICGQQFSSKMEALEHCKTCPAVQQSLREQQVGGTTMPSQYAQPQSEQNFQQSKVAQPVPGDPTQMGQAQPDPNVGPTPQPAGPQTQQPSQEDPINVGEGLDQTPAGKFDDTIQDLADRAAALHFSQPDDDVVQAIADQYDVDPEDVKRHLKVVTNFGDYTAVNGQLGGDESTDGLTDVSEAAGGGKVASHEALVPVDMAVQKVADDLGMQSDLVYDMVKDHYGGADLPDKYHASVSGERHLYLPGGMVRVKPNTNEQPPQQQPQQQAPAPPMPQPAPQQEQTLPQ